MKKLTILLGCILCSLLKLTSQSVKGINSESNLIILPFDTIYSDLCYQSINQIELDHLLIQNIDNILLGNTSNFREFQFLEKVKETPYLQNEYNIAIANCLDLTCRQKTKQKFFSYFIKNQYLKKEKQIKSVPSTLKKSHNHFGLVPHNLTLNINKPNLGPGGTLFLDMDHKAMLYLNYAMDYTIKDGINPLGSINQLLDGAVYNFVFGFHLFNTIKKVKIKYIKDLPKLKRKLYYTGVHFGHYRQKRDFTWISKDFLLSKNIDNTLQRKFLGISFFQPSIAKSDVLFSISYRDGDIDNYSDLNGIEVTELLDSTSLHTRTKSMLQGANYLKSKFSQFSIETLHTIDDLPFALYAKVDHIIRKQSSIKENINHAFGIYFIDKHKIILPRFGFLFGKENGSTYWALVTNIQLGRVNKSTYEPLHKNQLLH